MAALKPFKSGVSVNDLCRQVGVSPATFYKWKAKYGGLDASELSRLRELEEDEEHRRLKQMYADLSLRAHAMELVLSKKVLSLDQRRDVVARLVEAESIPAHVACCVVGLPRSRWYYMKRGRPTADDPVIEAFLRDCVARRLRRGFRKCFMRARRAGHSWNHKRVYRVYKGNHPIFNRLVSSPRTTGYLSRAVLYRYRAGISWRDPPESFGDFHVIHLRHSR